MILFVVLVRQGYAGPMFYWKAYFLNENMIGGKLKKARMSGNTLEHCILLTA